MKFGIFNVPYATGYTAGRRSVEDVIEWDLQVTEWADRYGLDEAYFAEHYTLGTEPSPAPDLMIAAASQRTERIHLGAAAHLLPYHNPVALAHRIMWLDHMTHGRYIAGFAPGAYPSDAQLFGTGVNNPRMMNEALDIVDAILYRDIPFKIEGEYFTADMPAWDDSFKGPHLKPKRERIPAIMTGMQAKSPTLATAGRRGFFPLSQQVHNSILKEHWGTYADAASSAGHEPSRANWKVCRDTFVADTDEEARRLVLEGGMGSTWRDYNLDNFIELGIGQFLTGGTIPDSELTVEWMVDNLLIVGSPDTVAEKIERLYHEVGGFGTLISFGYEYSDDPEAYRRNFEVLGTEVAPRLAHLNPAQ